MNDPIEVSPATALAIIAGAAVAVGLSFALDWISFHLLLKVL